MRERERRTIHLALSILAKASTSHERDCRTDGVRLALRVLLPYVEGGTLAQFWTIAGQPVCHSRGHNLRRQRDLIQAICHRQIAEALQAEMPPVPGRPARRRGHHGG